MKRFFALFVVLSITCTAGCAQFSQWWQNFEKDPVAQVQSFEQGAQIVLSDIAVAWESIKIFLPAAVVAQAQQQFDKAVASVNHALAALQDAVQAAVDAKNDAPNFSKAILDVNNAIQEIIAIVNTYRAQQLQAAGGALKLEQTPGYDEAVSRAVGLKHFAVSTR